MPKRETDIVPCKHGYVGRPQPWHGTVSFDYYDARSGEVVEIPDTSDAKIREIGKDLSCSKKVIDDLLFQAEIARSKFPSGK